VTYRNSPSGETTALIGAEPVAIVDDPDKTPLDALLKIDIEFVVAGLTTYTLLPSGDIHIPGELTTGKATFGNAAVPVCFVHPQLPIELVPLTRHQSSTFINDPAAPVKEGGVPPDVSVDLKTLTVILPCTRCFYSALSLGARCSCISHIKYLK
jgi:hypothetical protein